MNENKAIGQSFSRGRLCFRGIQVEKLYVKGILLHFWWERKLVQPLWKIAWSFLKKTKNRVAI